MFFFFFFLRYQVCDRLNLRNIKIHVTMMTKVLGMIIRNREETIGRAMSDRRDLKCIIVALLFFFL